MFCSLERLYLEKLISCPFILNVKTANSTSAASHFTFSVEKMKLLLNLVFLEFSSVSGNVFGRPRTLAQKAKRLRVNDFVDKYENVQGPVGVVEIQSEVTEEIEVPGTI